MSLSKYNPIMKMKKLHQVVVSECGLYEGCVDLEKTTGKGVCPICVAILEDDRIRTFRVRMPIQVKGSKLKRMIKNTACARYGFNEQDEILSFDLVAKSKLKEYYMVQIIPFSYVKEVERSLVEKNIKIRDIDTFVGLYLKKLKGSYMFAFVSKNQTHIYFKSGDYFEISKISLGCLDIVDEKVEKHMRSEIEKAVEIKESAFGSFKLYAPRSERVLFLSEIGFEETDL